jgi:hypothetical protein
MLDLPLHRIKAACQPKRPGKTTAPRPTRQLMLRNPVASTTKYENHIIALKSVRWESVNPASQS